MKIRLLVVGHLKETYWKEAQNEYLKRLTPYAKVDIEEVDDLPFEIKAIKAWEDDNIVRKRHFDPKKTLTNEQIQQAQPEKGRVKGVKQRAEAEKVRENANDVAAVPASKSKNMTLDQLNSSR